MGREVKRVHIDFDWFDTHENDTWKGYLFNDEVVCPLCDGKGENSHKKRCPVCYGDGKVYRNVEPPKAWDEKENGYQIWQNVSEGGPVSPVFQKAEDLAQWMVDNDTSVTRGTSFNAWLKMIKEEGGCPSGIGSIGQDFSSGMVLYEKSGVSE